MRTQNANTLRTAPRDDRGFSILEIVIAMIIISILTLALIPTVTNRARRARIGVAERDARVIADAQERLSVDTGFYARLYVLDDVTNTGDNVRNDATDDLIDGTNDEDPSTTGTAANFTAIDTIWINTITEDFQASPATVTSRFIANEEVFGWVGPYVSWNLDVNNNDWPDDPWGNDYLLVTKVGALFTPELVPGETVTDDQFVTSITTTTLWGGGTLSNLDSFDRPAIISFGPDREPGDSAVALGSRVLGNGDDIIIYFGGYGEPQ